MVTNSFPIAGSTDLIACGMMMKRIDIPRVIPKERAASPCPRSTPWIPARKISAR
ncbi:hypothetical protein D1872_316370 [compost metagenome]